MERQALDSDKVPDFNVIQERSARASLSPGSVALVGVVYMRRSGWTPSIVPKGYDQNGYLVIDDFGRDRRVYREPDVETTNLETVITDLLEGQYESPTRIVAFNTAEKWSRDVSTDVARELRHRCDL
jgi:hypothetical protein